MSELELAADDEVLEPKQKKTFKLTIESSSGAFDRFWLTSDELDNVVSRLMNGWKFPINNLVDIDGDHLYIPDKQIVRWWWREYDRD